MLAVLAIVAVILAMTPTLFQGLLTSSGVSGGAEIAAGIVAEARSEAQLSTGEVRLVVDTHPGSPGYLQRMAVAREVEFDDGSRKWVPTSSAKFLPGGVFLYEPYVGGEQTMTFQYSSSRGTFGMDLLCIRFAGKTGGPAQSNWRAFSTRFYPGRIG